MLLKNIQLRDPQHLKNKYQPALRRLPELPDGSEEFLALCAGLKKVGFIQPILVDEADNVIDDHSRSLLRAAIRWQFKDVPVQVRSSLDAPMLRIHSLAHVRHLSKSAIAYLAVPDLQPALDASRQRRLENLRKTPDILDSNSVAVGEQTLEELAAELGISKYLLTMAAQVRKAFEDKKLYTFNVQGGAKDGDCVEMTLKDWFEPRILQAYVGGEHEQNRPMGLGGILAGITAVREGDKSKFAPKPKQGDFFADLFTTDLQKFNKLSDSRRAAALAAVHQAAEELPPEECDKAADTMFEMGRIYREAAAKSKKATK